MARPRTPTEILEMNGSFVVHPERRRAPAPKSENAFGTAPKYFRLDERKCWNELVANSAAGVLTGADRWLAETACLLMAKQRRRETMTGAELGIILNSLSKMGLTPVDRTRLSAPAEKTTVDPYAEFSLT